MGQAQFIEQPVATSTQDAHINRLFDYLREHVAESHTIDVFAARTAMSRRTFTRHFHKATGMTVVAWPGQQGRAIGSWHSMRPSSEDDTQEALEGRFA